MNFQLILEAFQGGHITWAWAIKGISQFVLSTESQNQALPSLEVMITPQEVASTSSHGQAEKRKSKKEHIEEEPEIK